MDSEYRPTWIPIQPDFIYSVGVLMVAARLGITENHAAGIWLHWLLHVNARSRTGRLLGITKEQVDRIVGAQGFAEVAEEVGWIEFDRNGCQMRDWDNWNGPIGRTRARKARWIKNFRFNHPHLADGTH